MTPLIELIIGYAAALLVSLLQLPQVYKTYQIKSADELSIYMILLNFLASILWLVYGIILSRCFFAVSCCFLNFRSLIANVGPKSNSRMTSRLFKDA